MIVVNVYGPHDNDKKRKMWKGLENLMRYDNASWVICGDFNEVRNEDERRKNVFHDRRSALFNDFINHMKLVEIPLIGKRFTRVNDDGSKFRKLDRLLVSDLFLQMWNEVSVIALERKLTDHCPIMLRDMNMDFSPKPFKLFDVWLESKDIEPIIVEAWNKPVESQRKDGVFQDRLKKYKECLKRME
ncbi:uncharacterized protein [Rutidosis leptorrhynchoides]|uniref:uncharacterized protein n=1 Tax=Rutidosis leptorrhynchoides TaxID=125765 RepID=UPI003A99C880